MARIGRENGDFDIDDVCRCISDKLVRRHPHVFADREVSGAAEVVSNWEDIKREEKGDGPPRSALDGVPTALPGLLKAYRVTEKAAAVGFDWRRPEDVVDKLHEEVRELVLEVEADFSFQIGQSIGVLAPGSADFGHEHHFRLYSVADLPEQSASGKPRIQIAVRRCFYLDPYSGEKYKGIASNYLRSAAG